MINYVILRYYFVNWVNWSWFPNLKGLNPRQNIMCCYWQKEHPVLALMTSINGRGHSNEMLNEFFEWLFG